MDGDLPPLYLSRPMPGLCGNTVDPTHTVYYPSCTMGCHTESALTTAILFSAPSHYAAERNLNTGLDSISLTRLWIFQTVQYLCYYTYRLGFGSKPCFCPNPQIQNFSINIKLAKILEHIITENDDLVIETLFWRYKEKCVYFYLVV